MLKISLSTTKMKLVIISVITYVLFLFVTALAIYLTENVSSSIIIFWGFFNNIIFILAIFSLRKIENRRFSLKSIILSFFFLFNFGQIFLWTLGIHSASELGKVPLYSNFRIPDNYDIFKALIFSMQSFATLCLGFFISTLLHSDFKYKNYFRNSQERSIILNLSIILGSIIIPLTFLKIIYILVFSLNNGYSALYYSNFSMNSILTKSEDYFFPVIVGLLLGSNYKLRYFVYSIFALYVALYALAGERGNWIYKIIILFWMHSNFFNKLDYKKIIKWGFFSGIFLYLIGIIVNLRQYGLGNVTLNQIIEEAATTNNIFTRYLFEMGNSIGITLMAIFFGAESFSWLGNTYLTSLLASFSTKIALILGANVYYPANFLSQDILKINWGTGFNFFAESFINFGWLGFTLMFIFGLVFSNITRTGQNDSVITNYFSCINASIICSMVRDSSLNGFRLFTQVSLLLYLIIKILEYYRRKRIYYEE